MHSSLLPEEAPETFEIASNEHRATIMIRWKKFFLEHNPSPYYRCCLQTLRCCPAGISEHDVSSAAAERCRERYEEGYWVKGPSLHEVEDNSRCGSQAIPQAKRHSSNSIGSHPNKLRGVGFGAARARFATPGNAHNVPRHKNRPDPVDKAAEEFHSKVTNGLASLSKLKAASSVGVPSDFGLQSELLMIQEQRHDHSEKQLGESGKQLEKALELYSKKSSQNTYLSKVCSRYTRLYCQSQNKDYRETPGLDKDAALRKLHKFCMVASKVVNELTPTWGVYAILVFAALEQTRFLASSLRDMKISEGKLEKVANEVSGRLSELDQITVPMDFAVPNPALFLSCVLGVRYEDVCRAVGLDQYAQFNLQTVVDARAKCLGKLGIDCCKVSMSELRAHGQKPVHEFKVKESKFISIHLKTLPSFKDAVDDNKFSLIDTEHCFPKAPNSQTVAESMCGMACGGLTKPRLPLQPELKEGIGYAKTLHSISTQGRGSGMMAGSGVRHRPILPKRDESAQYRGGSKIGKMAKTLRSVNGSYTTVADETSILPTSPIKNSESRPQFGQSKRDGDELEAGNTIARIQPVDQGWKPQVKKEFADQHDLCKIPTRPPSIPPGATFPNHLSTEQQRRGGSRERERSPVANNEIGGTLQQSRSDPTTTVISHTPREDGIMDEAYNSLGQRGDPMLSEGAQELQSPAEGAQELQSPADSAGEIAVSSLSKILDTQLYGIDMDDLDGWSFGNFISPPFFG